MIRIAKRLETQAQKSFGMYESALELENTGADLIHLEIGRPSSDTPLHIKEAAKAALDEGIVHYGDLQGNAALREALAQRYRERNNIDVNADEILITNGVTQSAFAAIMTLVDEGDEVIVLGPFYPQHNSKIELVGGTVVPVSLDRSKGFRLDAVALENAITAATKMVVLVNPSNPVGTMYSEKELLELSKICIRHDLVVLADEVYEFNTYEDRKHISIASLAGMKERTITISAFTKAYAMDGWRIGYTAAPKDIIKLMNKITMNDTTHPCVFAQEGALAAVTGPLDCVNKMVADDCRRRDLVMERLNKMTGVHCHKPEATIYAFPDISELGLSSDELAKQLLSETHVVVESGTFYGDAGEGHLRICFGSESYERIDEAMDRIEKYLATL
jgi:aspartate aminotransferase